MALPLFAAGWLASIGGAVVAGLTQFVMSRLGLILAGLGLTIVSVKGFEVFIGYVVSDLNQIVSGLNAAGGEGGMAGLGQIMLQYAAFAGLFDAINIVVSGYMAFASFAALRFIAARLSR